MERNEGSDRAGSCDAPSRRVAASSLGSAAAAIVLIRKSSVVRRPDPSENPPRPHFDATGGERNAVKGPDVEGPVAVDGEGGSRCGEPKARPQEDLAPAGQQDP